MKRIHTASRAAPRSRAWPVRRTAQAAALALGLALTAAWAAGKHDHDHEHDHDKARAAVAAGEILPLPALLEQLQRSNPGQVLALELEKEDGRWIYEVKLLQPDGRLVKLDVDARTAQVLKLEAKRTRGGRSSTSASEPAQ